jgi:hypothetical protein
VNGGANKDGPDLSWKVWVTVPRQGAVKVRRETRALYCELRSGRTLKYASGMTSTRWRTAAHGATGRLHSRFAGDARSAPPRQSGVLNKSLGFDRPPPKAPGFAKPWRGQEPVAYRLPNRFPRNWEQSLATVPEGRTRHTRLLIP